MTRPLPAAMATHLEDEDINWAVFLDLDLTGDRTRMWSGSGTINVLGVDWLGIGEFGSIAGVGEPTDLTEQTIQVALNMVPEDSIKDLIAVFADNNQVGQAWTLHIAVFDEDLTLEGVHTMNKGFINKVTFMDSSAFAAIQLELASDMTLLSRKHFRNMNNPQQQLLFPGDLGLEYVNDLDDELMWGFADKQKGVGKIGSNFSPNKNLLINRLD